MKKIIYTLIVFAIIGCGKNSSVKEKKEATPNEITPKTIAGKWDVVTYDMKGLPESESHKIYLPDEFTHEYKEDENYIIHNTSGGGTSWDTHGSFKIKDQNGKKILWLNPSNGTAGYLPYEIKKCTNDSLILESEKEKLVMHRR